MPQVSNLFNNVPTSRLSVATNQIQVVRPNLRNLAPETGSSSSTLVLFDGHRIAGVGVTQIAVDPDIIPPIAIERVEVVTDGGSATYGADAVGGVINFITRKRFDGLKVDARYGFADDYYQVDASGIVGKDWGSGSVYAAYNYQHNDAHLRPRPRLHPADRLAHRTSGWPLVRSRQRQPEHVVNRFRPSLSSLSPTRFRTWCRTRSTPAIRSDDTSFVPRSTRHGAVAGLHQDLTDWLTVDLRAFYGERKSTSLAPFRGQANVTSRAGLLSADRRHNPGGHARRCSSPSRRVLGRNSARSRRGFQGMGRQCRVRSPTSTTTGSCGRCSTTAAATAIPYRRSGSTDCC